MEKKIALLGLLVAAASFLGHTDVAQGYSYLDGPNRTSRVVLTYDDCPKSLARYMSVLRWARNHRVGLVLAPTGDCIRSFGRSYGVNLATRARAYGQYVINHSTHHRAFTSLSNSQVRGEVTHGVRSPYVRPPGGAHNARVRQVLRGMTPSRQMWLWNVDTRDWEGKSQSSVVSYVSRNTGRGDTVLMHFQWNGFNVTALNQMRSRLAARGLSLCRAYGVASSARVRTSPVWLPARLPC